MGDRDRSRTHRPESHQRLTAPAVVDVAPGHDAWVPGDEPGVLIEDDFEEDTVVHLDSPASTTTDPGCRSRPLGPSACHQAHQRASYPEPTVLVRFSSRTDHGAPENDPPAQDSAQSVHGGVRYQPPVSPRQRVQDRRKIARCAELTTTCQSCIRVASSVASFGRAVRCVSTRSPAEPVFVVLLAVYLPLAGQGQRWFD